MSELRERLDSASAFYRVPPDAWERLERRVAARTRTRRVATIVTALVLGLSAIAVAVTALSPKANTPTPRTSSSVSVAAEQPPGWVIEEAALLARNNQDPSPTAAYWVLADANTIAPAVGLATSPGAAGHLEYLVVLYGSFTDVYAHIPSGGTIPTGSVIAFTLDLKDHGVNDFSIGSRTVEVPGLQPFTLTPAPSGGETVHAETLAQGALAFVSAAEGRRILVLFGGTSIPREVVGPNLADVGISLSAEGQVAYAVGLSDGTAEIRIQNLNGSPGAYTVRAIGADRYPAWSVRASSLAFSDGKAIDVWDAATQKIRAVTTPPLDCVDVTPTWFPHGTKLGFWRDCDASQGSGIYEIAADGGSAVRILQTSGGASQARWPGTTISGIPTGIAWSPDGASIAFQVNDGSVWLVDACASNSQQGGCEPSPTMLVGPDPTPASEGFGTIAWSRTGSELAFVRSGAVYVVDPTDGKLAAIAGTIGLLPTALSWGQ